MVDYVLLIVRKFLISNLKYSLPLFDPFLFKHEQKIEGIKYDNDQATTHAIDKLNRKKRKSK